MRLIWPSLFAGFLLCTCSSGKLVVGWENGKGTDAGEEDTFLPWHGGPPYYRRWPRGPSSDPNWFPLGVWMQNPNNAARFSGVGINWFIGLWQGPTDEQLNNLAPSGIDTLCDQAGSWKANLTNSTIRGWTHVDGPDNAQLLPNGDYGPCIAPSTLLDAYNGMVANDASRPVFVGLGRGVVDTQWVGRGTCTGRTDMYPEYVKAADILAFHFYAVNTQSPLEMVAQGTDSLRRAADYKKPMIMTLEASNIEGVARPTAKQIRAQVWMALAHDAAGILYYCHRFKPTFSETDCLEDVATANALREINAQVTALAPVLNTQSVGNGVRVSSSSPVDFALKRYNKETYLFTVGTRSERTTATFTLRAFPELAEVTVIGEDRTLVVNNGVFQDDFDGYAVHLYRIK